jgi:DNA-3-methyladenine glycosylase I
MTLEVLKSFTTSAESIAMSKDLKKRGWSFVGPTTVYAFMQAMGLVNDHIDGCSVREAALAARAALKLPLRP